MPGVCYRTPAAIALRNATASVFHQRHIGWVLRSSCHDRGRRLASSRSFARTIDAAKKYVVSSTLHRVDWSAELVRGLLGNAVQRLKQQSGKGLFVAGVTLPLALAALGLPRRQ